MFSIPNILKKTIQQFLIITIIFILSGSLFNFWGLWILYLLPTYLLYLQVERSESDLVKIYQSFFIATTLFLGVGVIFDVWHPTWLVFLLPLIIHLGKKKDDKQ